jgi:hypothetical protein
MSQTLRDFITGQRVALHPATDAFMQGDVYGAVVAIGRKYVSVRCDRSGRVRRVSPTLLMPLTT